MTGYHMFIDMQVNKAAMDDLASHTSIPVRTVEFSGAHGNRLEGDAHGDPSGRPILFLHGGGQTRHAWGTAARAVARDGWYAVTLDLRGHGRSDWSPDGRYTVDRFRDDVRCVAEQLPDRPVAIGASLGGLSSMMAEGLARRNYLSGLVMVDIVVRMKPSGVKKIVQFMRAYPDGFETLEQAADAISEYLPHRPRPDDLSGLKKNLQQRDDGRWVWHWDPRFLDRSIIGPFKGAWNLLRSHRRLDVPTLLVRGLKSELVDDKGVKDFLKRVPHADYADVRDAGHMVAGDRNDAFNDVVLDWLARTYRQDSAATG